MEAGWAGHPDEIQKWLGERKEGRKKGEKKKEEEKDEEERKLEKQKRQRHNCDRRLHRQ